MAVVIGPFAKAIAIPLLRYFFNFLRSFFNALLTFEKNLAQSNDDGYF